MPHEPVSLNLKEIAEQCTTLLTANAMEKEIGLQSDLAEYLFVYADKNMLDTVIRNLITNALKFTPKEGRVTVSARLGYASFVGGGENSQ